MKSQKTLTTFLGWCTVINFAFVLLTIFVWLLIQDHVSELGAEAFGVTAGEVKQTFLLGLTQYRIGIILLNLVPWLALKIMARTATSD